jgi:hypothetical protein
MMQTLFVKKVSKIVVYLVVYVDDLLITGNNEACIASIKKELKKGFEMTNMGYLRYYLGIEVNSKSKACIHLPKEVHWRIVEQIWHC